jgi:hypothetical protein
VLLPASAVLGGGMAQLPVTLAQSKKRCDVQKVGNVTQYIARKEAHEYVIIAPDDDSPLINFGGRSLNNTTSGYLDGLDRYPKQVPTRTQAVR